MRKRVQALLIFGSLPRHRQVVPSQKSGHEDCPTLAEILKTQEPLRKYKARAKEQYLLELPKTKASDIEAIMKLYDDEGHPEWSVLAAKLETARTFLIPKASFPMFLGTGQLLSNTSNGKYFST